MLYHIFAIGLLFTMENGLISNGAKPLSKLIMSHISFIGLKFMKQRPSYLHNGISDTGKMASLYWIGTLRVWFLHVSLIYPNERSIAPCKFENKMTLQFFFLYALAVFNIVLRWAHYIKIF